MPIGSGGYWTSPAGLRQQAESCKHDNQAPGTPGYCEPAAAEWAVETLTPAQMANVFGSQEEAREWIEAEIAMDLEEGMGREWARLLTEEIREEIVVLVRDGLAYIWDGWHRAAASIATGRSLVAIVGRPMYSERPADKVT